MSEQRGGPAQPRFLSRLWNSMRLLYAGLQITWNPENLDSVLDAVAGAHAAGAEEDLIRFLKRDERTRQAFVTKPLLKSLPVAELASLPATTLGGSFARYLQRQNLDPTKIIYAGKPTTDDQAFMHTHFHQSHDIWHVVTGYHTDVAGELALQGFYLAQSHSVVPAMLIVMGLVNALLRQRGDLVRRMESVCVGFAAGRAARPLFGIAWDRLWKTDLALLRQDFGINSAGRLIPSETWDTVAPISAVS